MKVFVLLLFTVVFTNASEILSGFTLTNNQFTADIYKEHKADAEDNFVLSPLSLEILLALIHAGADGKTADELFKALRLPQKREAIDEIYRELYPKLQINAKYILQSANKIYVRNKYSVKEQYNTTAVEVFGASIQNIDFGQKKAAAAEINRWVDENTQHKISKLVKEDDITEELRAVLLNAIYFKGKWEKAFKKDNTKSKPFYLTSKSYVETDTMETTDYFRYHKSSTLKAKFVELPYKGDKVTMTLVLPDSIEGLPELEEHIHEVVVDHKYTYHQINLKMPKNKIETGVELNEILKKLGITEAFTSQANFQQMLNATGEPLFISKVVQKALIETDEEGTVAAAVTGGFMATRLSAPPPKPINFHADHPFIFFLKHKEIGVLFIGRYTKPDGTPVALNESAKEHEEEA